MKEKTKILTVTTSGLMMKEGISTVILDYYSYFDKSRFEMDIIADGVYSNRLIEEFEHLGVRIQYLPSRKKSSLPYVLGLMKLFREERYDALYIHGSSAIMSMELLVAKMFGCRIRVVHSHNTSCDHKKMDRLLRPLFYRLYTQALACGQAAGNWLFGGKGFDVVRNGRDIASYQFDARKRKEMRRMLNLSDDTFVMGHVGNFNEQKNQKFLISILKEMLERKKDVRLFLMGDGQTKKEIQKLVRESGLSGYVVFTGSIVNVADMLQAMDAMILPSLHEGSPLVAVEWQICGLPSVLADTVTKECAYTQYVQFQSLNDAPSVWAETILGLQKSEREVNARRAIDLTKRYGFDISENARKLQAYFCC